MSGLGGLGMAARVHGRQRSSSFDYVLPAKRATQQQVAGSAGLGLGFAGLSLDSTNERREAAKGAHSPVMDLRKIAAGAASRRK